MSPPSRGDAARTASAAFLGAVQFGLLPMHGGPM